MLRRLKQQVLISIHAPRVGSDCTPALGCAGTATFQSTLPVWGATIMDWKQIDIETFQSTLPVWGATYLSRSLGHLAQFQSTLPVWGATCYFEQYERGKKISIHAPRVGSDIVAIDFFMAWDEFQSTLPVWGATM